MKTKPWIRLGVAGLVLAVLAVLAAAPVAQGAAVVSGSGSTSTASPQLSQLQRAHGGANVTYSVNGRANRQLQLPSLAQIQQHQQARVASGGGSLGSSQVAQLQLPSQSQIQQHQAGVTVAGGLTVAQAVAANRHGLSVPYAAAANSASAPVQTAASSGVSATTIWIASVSSIAAIALIVLVIVGLRRRHRMAPGCESSLAGC